MAAAGCSENTPTAPTMGDSIAPTASASLKASPPAPRSPGDGTRIDTRRPTLVVENAQGVFAPIGFAYRFEVVGGDGGVIYDSGPVGEGDGTTAHQVPFELDGDRTFWWRAQAVLMNGSGPWSDYASFSTPGSVSAPDPGPRPSGTCISGSPLAIVECERAKYGYMGESEMFEFIRNVAFSLNASGVQGGPYGLLRKWSGHNCHGFSCDIICAGQGGGQRQYDILGDIDGAQTPGWSGPLGSIRVDSCEIP